MKSPLSKLISCIIILFFNKIYSQNIYESIEREYGFIVTNEKLNIKYYFDRILQNEEEIENLNKTQFAELKIAMKNYDFQNKKLTKKEIGEKFYILRNDKKYILSKDSIKFYSFKNNLSKIETKKTWRKVKNYNKNVNEWRHFPISISDIIYTSDKKLAMITINCGNDGGSVNVYENDNGKWILIDKIYRWSY